MLPFGVTIPAIVPQRSEIPDRLMNYSVQTQNFDTKLNFGLGKNLTIFRMDIVVLQIQSDLYQLNSWLIAAMPTRFARGFPVIAPSDVLLRESSMLVTATRLLY